MRVENEYENIRVLFATIGLGEILNPPNQVTGGLLHKMYQVTINNKAYAVKVMNPIIMNRNGVIDKISKSESVAKVLKEKIPVISALEFNGRRLLKVENQYYLVFEWSEGKSVFPPYITEYNCKVIGNILGEIHSTNIKIPEMKKEASEMPNYDWDEYLKLGLELKAEWVSIFESRINDLKKWNKKARESCNELNDHMIISHRDLDPKNVIWDGKSPYVIDWEAAGYVNPYQELLEVVNYWADDGYGELQKEKFDVIYEAYTNLVDCKDVNWAVVMNSGYAGMLGWLDYSFKKSLGIEAESEEEMKEGSEQIFGTMKCLEEYSSRESILLGWFRA